MAPVWMAMSKTLAFSPVKSSSDAGQDQVAGGRDRQELGQPLDHAHDRGLAQQQDVQRASPFGSRAARSKRRMIRAYVDGAAALGVGGSGSIVISTPAGVTCSVPGR